VTASQAAPALAASRSRSASRRRRGAIAWLFMAPTAVVNLLVVIGPGAQAVWYSFTDWTGVGSAKFIGLANYRKLLVDQEFAAAFLHNMYWTAFFLTIPMAMGLAGAFLLSRVRRFQLLYRVALFLPYVVATVVTAAIWQNLLNPDVGLPHVLSTLGFSSADNLNPLGDPHLALGTVAFVNMWQWWGFLVVVYLAAMQGVDHNRYEAARIDGASTWQEFWHITLPGIRPTLVFLSLMSVVWSFLVFDYIYILTKGGPAGATDVMGTLLYREAFANQNAGYAASVGIVMTLFSSVVVGGYLWIRRKGWDV
jgi:raffinose/stachyose/melibiose transport system permease protein